MLVAGGLLLCGCGEASAPRPAPSSHDGNRALYDPDAPVPEMSADEVLEAVAGVNRIWRQRKAVFRSRFLGVPTQQNPADAWIVQEIISEQRPDLMIETGTFQGGSAMLWAMLLENVNPEARVITIDIADQRSPRARAHPLWENRIDFLLGSSAAPEVVAEVRRRAEGKNVLVLLDSLHTAEHVAKELAAYAPLVPVGGYVIVQDTPLDAVSAIREFVAANANWEIDDERERFALTNSMRGYLKRVR